MEILDAIQFIILFILAIIMGYMLGEKHKKNEKESFPISKQSIISLVDEMIVDIEEYPFNEYNAGYKCCLSELKHKIEQL